MVEPKEQLQLRAKLQEIAPGAARLPAELGAEAGGQKAGNAIEVVRCGQHRDSELDRARADRETDELGKAAT